MDHFITHWSNHVNVLSTEGMMKKSKETAFSLVVKLGKSISRLCLIANKCFYIATVEHRIKST